MARSGWLVVVMACAITAGCDDNPASPSSAPSVFSAQLSPANEVPAVANAESTARGAAQITFNVTRDGSGNPTGGTATMYFQIVGLPSGTVIRGAHIHSAAQGVNGPIVVDTGITPANTRVLADGTQEFSFSGVSVAGPLMTAILTTPSAYYFNVHTVTNPGGVARGQLVIVR